MISLALRVRPSLVDLSGPWLVWVLVKCYAVASRSRPLGLLFRALRNTREKAGGPTMR